MTISSSSNETKTNSVEKWSSGDDKKRRRMESNRESARRSRQRKQQHLDGLIKQLGSLKRENDEFDRKIGEFTTAFASIDAQNAALKGEKHRLAARLEVLENITDIAKGDRGSSSSSLFGISEGFYDVNGDSMMKPWQLSHHSLPINASSLLYF